MGSLDSTIRSALLLWVAAVIATMHRLPAPRRKWLKSRQHLAGGQRCMPAVEVPSQFFLDVIACLGRSHPYRRRWLRLRRFPP
jgi:hypothetical protein